MRPRNHFPAAMQQDLLTDIDRLMRRCYIAGLRAARDATDSVSLADVDPPKNPDGTVSKEYWTGRHQSRDAIQRLIELEEAEGGRS